MTYIKIESCKDCSKLNAVRQYTADSWEYVEIWRCKEIPNVLNEKDSIIAEYVERNEKPKIPNWCPLSRKNIKKYD